MQFTGLEIFKLLPKTDCRQCGKPTCIAFALDLASGRIDAHRCPTIPVDLRKHFDKSPRLGDKLPLYRLYIGCSINRERIKNDPRFQEEIIQPSPLRDTEYCYRATLPLIQCSESMKQKKIYLALKCHTFWGTPPAISNIVCAFEPIKEVQAHLPPVSLDNAETTELCRLIESYLDFEQTRRPGVSYQGIAEELGFLPGYLRQILQDFGLLLNGLEDCLYGREIIALRELLEGKISHFDQFIRKELGTSNVSTPIYTLDLDSLDYRGKDPYQFILPSTERFKDHGEIMISPSVFAMATERGDLECCKIGKRYYVAEPALETFLERIVASRKVPFCHTLTGLTFFLSAINLSTGRYMYDWNWRNSLCGGCPTPTNLGYGDGSSKVRTDCPNMTYDLYRCPPTTMSLAEVTRRLSDIGTIDCLRDLFEPRYNRFLDAFVLRSKGSIYDDRSEELNRERLTRLLHEMQKRIPMIRVLRSGTLTAGVIRHEESPDEYFKCLWVMFSV